MTDRDKASDPAAAAATPADALRFEERLAKLETLLEQLERGDLPLDEAIRTYETGVAELRRCYDLLDAADERVRRLVERPDGRLSLDDA